MQAYIILLLAGIGGAWLLKEMVGIVAKRIKAAIRNQARAALAEHVKYVNGNLAPELRELRYNFENFKRRVDGK